MNIQTNENLAPASFLQQQYWLNQRLHPETGAYNISYIWSLKGNLNIEAFTKAINSIINSYEVFRTNYVFENNILYQKVLPKVDFTPEFIDLSTEKKEFKLDNIHNNLLNDFMERPFNFQNDLPIRFCILKISEKEHYLSVAIHHIATDLYTWNTLFDSLSKYYKHFAFGNELNIKIEYNYKDYSQRYLEFTKTEEFSKKLDFWKNYLKEAPANTEFPIDKKRPKVFSNLGARKYFSLSKEVTTKLKELSDNEYIILFSYLLSSYALLIHKYSKQKKFAIGVPFTNRKNSKDLSVTGCFVNILPVIIDLENDITFKKLCSGIQKVMINVSRNQEIPYLQILNNLNLQFEPQYNPIFQFGFTYEPIIDVTLEGIESHTHRIVPDKQGSKLDQFMHIREADDQIQGYIEYCTSLFESETLDRISDNFINILNLIPENLDKPVSKIDIVSPKERENILVNWNNTFTEYESDKCIHQIFEKQVLKTPNAIALVSDKGEVSYNEFNNNVNSLANYILKLGIGKNERIGIFIERSTEMVTAIYAVLKAGGAYVPLDISNPWDRLEYIIEDSEIKVLITNQNLATKINSPTIKKIEIDSQWEEIKKESIENPVSEANENSVAYLIYTSGSTGKPKGVMIEHHSVINFINWRQRMYPLSEIDNSLLKTPITFDISVLELFWPLFYGAKLGVLASGSEKFPDQIIQTVSNFKVTFMQFVPSMLNVFLEFVNEQSLQKLSSLKYVSTIGEALSPETVNKFNSTIYKTNKTRLINTYGPTETTVEVSYYECTSDKPIEVVPIGKPMDNTGFYIVDEQNNITPIGVSGELLIGGAGIARGYFKRPELTAEKFIDNPFDKNLSTKVYRTGDLSRYLPDGNIEFLGRMDFQVKIRGYRIELGEIEVLMRKHPSVSDSVVVVKDYLGGEKAIIGYIVIKEGENGDKIVEEVFSILRDSLPDYMVPTSILHLIGFPMLSNGKIDRKALPVPDSISSSNTIISQPKSETEKEILEIWKETLNLSAISTSDNFFNIGGNSILLIQVATRVQKKYNIELEVVKLFEYPTISSFSSFLTSNTENNNSVNEEQIESRAAKMKSVLAQQKDRRRR